MLVLDENPTQNDRGTLDGKIAGALRGTCESIINYHILTLHRTSWTEPFSGYECYRSFECGCDSFH